MSDFSILIEEYLKSLGRKVSENTKSMYKYDLEILMEFLRDREISVTEVSYEVLQDYAEYLHKKRKYADSTQNRKLQLVKYIFKYLHDRGYIENNPAIKLELPQIPEKIPRHLSLTESQKLIKTVDKEKNEYLRIRDKAIVLIFLNYGLRLSEVANLELFNIKEDRVIFNGKRNKENFFMLNDIVSKAIKDYINVRPDVDSKYLFLSTHKKQIQPRAIQLRIKKYLDLANLKGYSTHKLRHTAAVLMLEQGVGIRSIQKLYGHKNVSTTEIYANVTEGIRKDAAEKMNGLFL